MSAKYYLVTVKAHVLAADAKEAISIASDYGVDGVVVSAEAVSDDE